MPYSGDIAEVERKAAEKGARLIAVGEFVAGLAGVIWAVRIILGKRV